MQSEADPRQTGKMVAVASFESPVEAQLAKGMLESAGIECQLTGENANQLIQAAFEVQLEVKAEDEEAARELLGSTAEESTMTWPESDTSPEDK
jgi:hypothetical protein